MWVPTVLKVDVDVRCDSRITPALIMAKNAQLLLRHDGFSNGVVGGTGIEPVTPAV